MGSEGSSVSIGLLVLAQDEEVCLPRCIESVVRDTDQIVVVDMASRDRTADVASSFGAQVVEVPKQRYFDAARQTGLDALRTDWVLQMDADEWAPDLLARVRSGGWLKRADALRCPKLNYLANEVYRGQGWWPNMQVRLFKREVGRYRSTFHRFLEVEGTVADLPAQPGYAIHHIGTATASEMIANAARYIPVESTAMSRPSVTGAFARPLARYLLSRAWRDGSDGVAIFGAHVLNELGRRTSRDD